MLPTLIVVPCIGIGATCGASGLTAVRIRFSMASPLCPPSLRPPLLVGRPATRQTQGLYPNHLNPVGRGIDEVFHFRARCVEVMLSVNAAKLA